MYGNTGQTESVVQSETSHVDDVPVTPAPASESEFASSLNKEAAKYAAPTEAISEDVGTITLKKPFTLNGKHYKTLWYDFGKLSFADLEMMEMDMTTKGMAVMKNAFLSDVYCMYVAAMACGINVNDLKKHLGFKDCFRVIGAARNFLKDADSDQSDNSATK